MKVLLYSYKDGEDREVGHVKLEGGQLVAYPSQYQWVVEDGIIIGDRVLFASDDPMEYLQTLYKVYRSVALRASEVQRG